jgi:signal transduction histidine kinase/DNA-binding response OmpR family regulator
VSPKVDAKTKVSILVVDDRPENLVALKAILDPLGQNIVEAKSGKEALKCLLAQEFAVILMDVMMPEMDGFETARMVRKREKTARTPIIFVTAMLTEEAHAFQGYEAGAVDYIMKPFVPEILRSKVAVFVELFRKTDEVRVQSEQLLKFEQREYELRIAEVHKKMEAEAERVRFEQQITQAIMHHSPMGILRLSNSMSVAEANPVFCDEFQFDPDFNRNKQVSIAVPWLPKELLAAAKKNERFSVNDFKYTPEENEKKAKWWDLTSWPVNDAQGTISGTVIVATDVTERLLIEEQRKDFISTLAHDLQTPVIASDRALELIIDRLQSTVEQDLVKLASMLRTNNQNLLHMIQSLLDVYHYEAGAKALYFDDVDLSQLVSTCVEELTPLAENLGRKIINKSEGDSQLVAVDRTALRRVITNLLDNAIKFSNEGGTVEVKVSSDPRDEQVLLEVTDFGVGISDEDKKRLFERFWHGSGHKTYKGSTGLGLYLCRQIATAHGGMISCESEVGKMTKFTVTLPKRPGKLVSASKLEARSVSSL